MLAAVPEHYQLLVRTLATTGLRWGEALGPRKDAIARKRDGTWTLTVKQVVIQADGKCKPRGYGKTSHARRTIAISPEIGSALLAAASKNKDSWCFRPPRGGWIYRSGFHDVWARALKEAGLTGIRVHDLRHTACSMMLAGGADLVSVRDYMGHASIATTSLYAHQVGSDQCLAALTRAMAA